MNAITWEVLLNKNAYKSSRNHHPSPPTRKQMKKNEKKIKMAHYSL
jgi:hypothetical protein